MTKSSWIREPGNFITHFLPAILALPGLWLLLSKADTPKQVTAALIYGGGIILLFSISSLYHSIPKNPKQLRFWQKMDHCSIYVMIAGSFTPTCLVLFDQQWGERLFIFIWSFALVGILLKLFNRLRKQWLSTGLYIAMGCVIIPFVLQMAEKLSASALIWLFLGGVFYIGGTYFYAKDKPLYKYLHSHELWHLFVNAGALAHFIYNYTYIL